MLKKVIENWTSRLDYIRASRGSPMPEIIFKIQIEAHEIHRDKGLEVRLSFGFGLEHHTGDSTNKLGEIPRRDDRWRHQRSPPPQFKHRTDGKGNILQSPALVIKPKTLGPTDLTSTYSVCTRRVFMASGIRTQAFRSGVRCRNH
ncbi:hypothetical protein TNCV_1293571 [Trichonephila clavipes]|nr:hypothetical protein TNCV_1293571 [Trichonephila clavipes]